MLVVHHLNDSRSQRILWLLEELGLPYAIRQHQRDEETRLAPPELKAVHPLGKAPLLEDEDSVLHESGAIVDYLIRRHGGGRLAPAPGSRAHEAYLQWLHYAEGSAMLPLTLKRHATSLGDAGNALLPRVESEIALHLGYLDQSLQGKPWLLGDAFSGADIQMSFIGELAGARTRRSDYPALEAWVGRFQARPAYRQALAIGGPYAFGPA
jgi:glutathione S-transferase